MSFAAAWLAAAGVAAVVEVFGLNKSLKLNLPGEGDGAGCLDGAGVAVAFFIARCFAGVCDGEGDSAGLGDCACEIQIPAHPITAMRAEIFVIMSASVRSRRGSSQSNFRDTRGGRCGQRNFRTGLERASRLRYPLPGGPDSGMPQVGCGWLCRRLCPYEAVRGQPDSRRHSQTSVQNTANQARNIRVIDIRSGAFRFSVVAGSEIGLIGLARARRTKLVHPM